MKKTFAFILSILRNSIGTLVEIIGIIVLILGSFFYSLGLYIKDPKMIKLIIRESLKGLKTLNKKE